MTGPARWTGTSLTGSPRSRRGRSRPPAAATQLASDHLSRHVGNVLARDLGAAEIARAVAAVQGSPSLKNKVRGLAFQVNEVAAMEDPAVRLVARKWVRAAREKAPRLVVQSPRECLAVALSVPEQYRVGATLQAVFGLRAGESSAPLWCDLTPLGTIRVERQDDGEGGASEDLKSEESRRELPLPRAMGEMLRAHRERERREGRGRPTDPINATRTGTPVSEANLRRAVKAARARLGMPEYKGRPCHAFRHSLASWLDKEGCPEGIRLAIMGQSRDAVKDRYVHASPAEMLPWVERWWQAAQGGEPVEAPRRGGTKSPARGGRNGRSTMTAAKADEVRRLKGEGRSHAEIGRAVGVSPKVVLQVLQGEHWTCRPSTGEVVAATTLREDRVTAE